MHVVVAEALHHGEHILHFADISKPLNSLTQKDVLSYMYTVATAMSKQVLWADA